MRKCSLRTQETASHDLYWTIGDSGPQNDPFDRAQGPDTLHGSMVRVSVSSVMGSGYEIPGDNPYASGGENHARLQYLTRRISRPDGIFEIPLG